MDEGGCLRFAGTVEEGAWLGMVKAVVSPSKPRAASVASLGISSN